MLLASWDAGYKWETNKVIWQKKRNKGNGNLKTNMRDFLKITPCHPSYMCIKIKEVNINLQQ